VCRDASTGDDHCRSRRDNIVIVIVFGSFSPFLSQSQSQSEWRCLRWSSFVHAMKTENIHADPGTFLLYNSSRKGLRDDCESVCCFMAGKRCVSFWSRSAQVCAPGLCLLACPSSFFLPAPLCILYISSLCVPKEQCDPPDLGDESVSVCVRLGNRNGKCALHMAAWRGDDLTAAELLVRPARFLFRAPSPSLSCSFSPAICLSHSLSAVRALSLLCLSVPVRLCLSFCLSV